MLMAGMLQIYISLAFYLIIKELRFCKLHLRQIGKAGRTIVFGVLVLIICIGAALYFVAIQDQQALSLMKN